MLPLKPHEPIFKLKESRWRYGVDFRVLIVDGIPPSQNSTNLDPVQQSFFSSGIITRNLNPPMDLTSPNTETFDHNHSQKNIFLRVSLESEK